VKPEPQDIRLSIVFGVPKLRHGQAVFCYAELCELFQLSGETGDGQTGRRKIWNSFGCKFPAWKALNFMAQNLPRDFFLPIIYE
jgi:hypothetical protein